MFIDNSRFIYIDKIPDLTKIFCQEFRDITDWLDTPVISNQECKDDPTILEDLVPQNINLKALHLYDKNVSTSDTILKKFPLLCQTLSNLPEILAVHVAMVGPNSIVPLHTDSTNAGRDPLTENNVLIGCIVDESGKFIFKHGDISTNINKNQCLIFDGKIPHAAWNYSNKWAILMVLFIKEDLLKNETK